MANSKRIFSVIAMALVVIVGVSTATAARPVVRRYEVSQQTAAGPTPHFPAFDPTSERVLVSNVTAGTVTEIIPGNGPVRTFIAGNQPHTVVVDDDARRAYVTNKGSSTVSVLDLDSGNTLTSFPVGPNPHGLAVDNRRDRLYVTSIDEDRVEAYDLGSYSLVDSQQVGDGPWGVDVRGSVVAVTDTAGTTIHVLDADDLEVESVVEVGAGPWNVKIGSRGTLYATLERSGEVVAVRGGGVAWRTEVGATPHGIVIDEGRGVVLAAATGSNQIAVLGIRKGHLFHSVEVAPGPAGMSYDASTGNAYAGNQTAGVVTTLSPVRERSQR